MRVWRQHWSVWFLGATVCLGAALSNGDAAEAQSRGADASKGPTGSRTLKRPTVGDEGAAIVPAKSVRDDHEKPAPVVDDKASAKSVTTNPFAKQTDELWRCRYQVAAAARLAPGKVQAGKLILRFTVDTNGVPANTNVVAVEPADPDVLTCVKQEINRWRLLPVPLQAVPVEVEVSLALPQGTDDIAKR